MKNTSVVLSTYTADVSGVCSALYELGGMVVIHDPSGCNSTYNTHDEPRWYDQDSLVFISGLSEMDAIMGSDDKLITDICRAARQLSPRFIALLQTPVPFMTGVDFRAIGDLIEAETGLPVYYFPTNGMHSYIRGVNMALEKVAETMVNRPAPDRKAESMARQDHRTPRVNLLGVTPLDFSVNRTISSVRELLEDHGFAVQSCLAMGSGPEEIAGAGEADVNLVLSSAGIDAARVLYRRFHIPYVAGLPTGLFAEQVLSALRECIAGGESCISYRTEQPACAAGSPPASSVLWEGARVCLIGEPVICQSLREAFRMEYGFKAEVICCLESDPQLLADSVRTPASEDEIREELRDADVVIADPMFRPVCPDGVIFVPFPHEAFSGRIYRKQMADLTKPDEILYNDSRKEKGNIRYESSREHKTT